MLLTGIIATVAVAAPVIIRRQWHAVQRATRDGSTDGDDSTHRDTAAAGKFGFLRKPMAEAGKLLRTLDRQRLRSLLILSSLFYATFLLQFVITSYSIHYTKLYDLQGRISELAAEINRDMEGKAPIFICVLNGAFMFFADLVRQITIDCEVDFLKLSSYGVITSYSIHYTKLYERDPVSSRWRRSVPGA